MIPLDQGGGGGLPTKNELASQNNTASKRTQKIFQAEFHNSETGSEFNLLDKYRDWWNSASVAEFCQLTTEQSCD
jgi:hypothetical protein